ncbi:ABC transporter ATP-binding protein [Streptomyces roseoverticillatus]|uniref:ABC transporter ATP-binding protein n=1 Tax=Streptomyces roseoverticillatus TaxID=66429 RepID=UPI001F2D7B89|nr:ABC transporter ATP-binding protein [Streptomyces roseoverticillatus]MCF3103551.1 ABC transporter ATP-binding protein [Streptomyces roseoverticillatus]
MTTADGASRWAVEARGLGKRFRRSRAVQDLSVRIPAGAVCGLVGPNGAGKSTLLGMAARTVRPTEGSLRIFGSPVTGPAGLADTAYLAQDKPLFPYFTVEEMLRMGRELNPRWDQTVAERIVRSGKLPLGARVGSLSGGQRSRVALALAFGKRPRLLLLDEPMADLDPLAAHELGGLLLAEAAEQGTTVVMSSHRLADVATMCDHLLAVAGGRVRLAGETDELLAAHRLVTGVHLTEGVPAAIARHTVIESRTTGRQFTALIRPRGPVEGDWQIVEPGLEEVLLGYLRSPDAPPLLTAAARTDGPHGQDQEDEEVTA